MKGMKGRILKKLNSIPQIPYLKSNPLDPASPLESNTILDDHRKQEPIKQPNPTRDSTGSSNKENVTPHSSSFRRPDPNSDTLFDPNLLSAFRQAITEHLKIIKEATIVERDSIILYTTTIGGIRKTFEDCNNIRLLLNNLKLVFIERDISMHMEFREELWRVLGFKAIPPRVFVKGRYIGGADEVLGLHEQGRLLPLLEGVPKRHGNRGEACQRCAGMRFTVCFECNGGRRLYVDEQGVNVQCWRCNENGLIVCSLCCCSGLL